MRSLPAELTAELEKEIVCLAHLITVTISASEIYRWTDFKEGIVYGGYWYLSRGITFTEISSSYESSPDSITFTIDNVDKLISNLALTQATVGKECKIERVALDKNLQVVGGAAVVFLGYLDAMRINRQKAQIEVFDEMIKWRVIQCPRRLHSPSCQWIFKSTYCAYAGAATWCDHTWERCDILANTLNYGGFPSISDMVNKEIYWGRKKSGSAV